MKCSECKFWRLVERFDTDQATGRCHRHAPRAMFETPLLVAKIQEVGEEVAADPNRRPDALDHHDCYASWPVTWAEAFCGDFAPQADKRVGFV